MNKLKGKTANPGQVRGKVSVIQDAHNLNTFVPGSILVMPMTTPECTAIMQESIGIITERGGILCHAAIVSRELGKPCVVNARGIMESVKDGDFVTLDADTGEISLLGELEAVREV